jgi:peptidoglycan/LPS O-acetylase OafA/YrhL
MQYVASLDGIRALAILLVVLFHARVPYANGGFFGVDVFFVLSGYLITLLLTTERARTGGIDLLAFYVRRLRRLYPALLSFLVVYLAIAPWAWPAMQQRTHLRDAGIAALYLADYARTLEVAPVILRHMWSLSVEEHFYLVWPPLLILVLRGSRTWSIGVVLALYAAVTFWRAVSVTELGVDFWQVYHRFDTHSSGLLLGCLLGLLRMRAPPWLGMVGIAGLGLAIVLFRHKAEATALYGFTLAELSAALLVVAQPGWLGSAGLAWIGRMSYGLYLWHYLIMRLLRSDGWHWSGTLAVGLLGGLAMAALSYYTIEAVFRRKSERRISESRLADA